jgi:hypothetical protein
MKFRDCRGKYSNLLKYYVELILDKCFKDHIKKARQYVSLFYEIRIQFRVLLDFEPVLF